MTFRNRFVHLPLTILIFGLVDLHAIEIDLTSPLGEESELVLTGAFGEPRETGYHTGLDLLATHAYVASKL